MKRLNNPSAIHVKYKLLVFDWDGTLMDSVNEIIYCFRCAADDLHLPLPTDHQIKDIVGLAMPEAVSRLFSDQSADQRQALIERYRHHYFLADKTPSVLFDRVAEMLAELEYLGFFLAVATSKGRRGLDAVLQRTGLEKVFHVTRTADESFSKPHPQMLIDIMDYVGVAHHETLMIGDSEYDLHMAKNANVDAVSVGCGVHDEKRLLDCQPMIHLNNTIDLLDWLTQQG